MGVRAYYLNMGMGEDGIVPFAVVGFIGGILVCICNFKIISVHD